MLAVLLASTAPIAVTGLSTGSAVARTRASAALTGYGCNWIGQVLLVGFNYAQAGAIATDGQSLSIGNHATLYALLGHRFGGTNSRFNVADLRGKAPKGLHYVLCTSGSFPPRRGVGPTQHCNTWARSCSSPSTSPPATR